MAEQTDKRIVVTKYAGGMFGQNYWWTVGDVQSPHGYFTRLGAYLAARCYLRRRG